MAKETKETFKPLNEAVVVGLNLSLRDYFAAQSIQVAARDGHGDSEGAYWETVDGIASRAYLMADAMMKQRIK